MKTAIAQLARNLLILSALVFLLTACASHAEKPLEITAQEAVGADITIQESRMENGSLTILVNLDQTYVPLSLAETLGIQDFQITNLETKKVVSGGRAEACAVENGKACISVPTEKLQSGDYRLAITRWQAGKRADAPLCVAGTWEIPFHVG